jgi:hypothetical protein
MEAAGTFSTAQLLDWLRKDGPFIDELVVDLNSEGREFSAKHLDLYRERVDELVRLVSNSHYVSNSGVL